MKLRKQAPAKALIVAMTAGLLAAFYALVRDDPRIEAGPDTTPPAVDYQRFFAPAAAPSSAPDAQQPIVARGRTRAS